MYSSIMELFKKKFSVQVWDLEVAATINIFRTIVMVFIKHWSWSRLQYHLQVLFRRELVYDFITLISGRHQELCRLTEGTSIDRGLEGILLVGLFHGPRGMFIMVSWHIMGIKNLGFKISNCYFLLLNKGWINLWLGMWFYASSASFYWGWYVRNGSTMKFKISHFH